MSTLTPTFVLPPIEQLAIQASQRTNMPHAAWLQVLEATQGPAKYCLIDPDAYLALLSHASTPEQFLLICEVIQEYNKEQPYETEGFTLLLTHAQETHQALGSWMAAVEHLYGWLAKNDRFSPYRSILSFVDTCARTGPDVDLADVVSDTLERFGYPD